MTYLFKFAKKYKRINIEPHGYPTSILSADNPFIKVVLLTGIEL